ncbi:MAG: phospholipase D-like domain-containing protein [Gemmatimonadota bacterium]
MTLAAPRPGIVAATSLDRALDRAAGQRPIPGNRVRVLSHSPDAYGAMLDLIQGAERRVCLENYIVRSDETGWLFAEALADRARAGVEVRVLYDWFGSIGTRRKLWQFLRGAGVELRAFRPPTFVRLIENVSRNHRKVIVADGRRAIVGGLCIGNEWRGDPAKGIEPWRDTAVEIAGPAAFPLERAFAITWQRSGGRFDPAVDGEPPPEGDITIRPVVGEPGLGRAYRVTQLLAASCAERFWVTDAYLLAPPGLFHAMIDAAREGVDVRLLVPSSSDVPWIRNLTRFGYRDLLRAGVRIFEWEGPMLHAKTFVIDGRYVRVGSSNMNQSSFVANYELDILIDDERIAHEFEAMFRRDLARSAEVARRPLRAPRQLQRVLPSALERSRPAERAGQHRRTAVERRREAVRTLSILVAGSRRAIFGPLSLALFLLGALFILLPRPMSIGLGALLLWLAGGTAVELWRRRADR